MHVDVQAQPSCATAWLAAASAIVGPGEGYNVIIGVEDPTRFGATDNAVITLVDQFLRKYRQAPIITVANTIFPQSLLRSFGPTAFYGEYHKFYARLTTKRWGRYFERMTRRRGRDGVVYNPLQKIVEKLQAQNGKRSPSKTAYELPLYNPDVDGNQYRNMPCLSHLSFKRHPEGRLSLTAVYRNHTYVSRCLGNLIGLGRLQAFVAQQASLRVGPLTCVSTHAEIDKGDDKDRANNWGVRRARALIREAAALIDGGVKR
jgi:thymidylate synthase